MAVRNFYVKCDIDGRKTALTGGPQTKDGGLHLVLYQRNAGMIQNVCEIRCSEVDGKLITTVDAIGLDDVSIVTERQ